MTAPRTNIADELDGRNNEDIARQFGLSPATGPVPPMHPAAAVPSQGVLQKLVALLRAKSDATATGNASLPAQPIDTNQVKTRIGNDANQYSQNFDRSVAPQFDLDMGRGLFQLRPDAGDNLEAAKERMAAAEHRMKANRDTLAKAREGKIPTRTRP